MDKNRTPKTLAVLAAACVLAGASCATAAPVGHSRPAGWATGHDALARARTHRLPRAHTPRPNPYAYGYRAYPYSFRSYPSAEERWFDKAKGNIWGD
jgi:hypothetical protein